MIKFDLSLKIYEYHYIIIKKKHLTNALGFTLMLSNSKQPLLNTL
jgi:hypothetical protein